MGTRGEERRGVGLDDRSVSARRSSIWAAAGGHQAWGKAGDGSGLSCLVSVNGHDCSRGIARLGALSSAAAGLRRIIAGSLTPLPENVQDACRLFTYGGWSRCLGRLGCRCTCVQSGGKVE
jgi:hypothetical protein